MPRGRCPVSRARAPPSSAQRDRISNLSNCISLYLYLCVTCVQRSIDGYFGLFGHDGVPGQTSGSSQTPGPLTSQSHAAVPRYRRLGPILFLQGLPRWACALVWCPKGTAEDSRLEYVRRYTYRATALRKCDLEDDEPKL